MLFQVVGFKRHLCAVFETRRWKNKWCVVNGSRFQCQFWTYKHRLEKWAQNHKFIKAGLPLYAFWSIILMSYFNAISGIYIWNVLHKEKLLNGMKMLWVLLGNLGKIMWSQTGTDPLYLQDQTLSATGLSFVY